MKKGFSHSRAAASLLAHPHRRPGLPPHRAFAPAALRPGPAAASPAQAHAAPPARPHSRACSLLRRAARPTAAELARRVAAMRRRRRRAHTPAFTCRSQCARSLPPALPSLSSRAVSPKLRPRRAGSSAGVELPHHRATL